MHKMHCFTLAAGASLHSHVTSWQSPAVLEACKPPVSLVCFTYAASADAQSVQNPARKLSLLGTRQRVVAWCQLSL